MLQAKNIDIEIVCCFFPFPSTLCTQFSNNSYRRSEGSGKITTGKTREDIEGMTSNSPNRTNSVPSTATSNSTTQTNSSPSFSEILASFSTPFLPGGSDLFLNTPISSSPPPSSNLLSELTELTTTTTIPSSPSSSTLLRSQTESDLSGLGTSNVRSEPIRNFTVGNSTSLNKDDGQKSTTTASGSINNSGRRVGRKSMGVSIPSKESGLPTGEEEEVEDGVGKGTLVLEKYVLYETKLVSFFSYLLILRETDCRLLLVRNTT